MFRWSVLFASTVAAMSAAFVVGASVPAKVTKPPVEVNTEIAKAPVVVGQKTGYFNMAKVMREYKKAKYAVLRLNARKNRMSANLTGLRAMHTDLKASSSDTTDVKRRAQIEYEVVLLTREIEDLERAINKILNDKASFIISELYDEMHAVASAMSREKGLVVLLAYPDAVTAEEKENPQIKELKLKPSAAQPFYIDPSVDYSDEIIRRLNEKYNAEDDD